MDRIDQPSPIPVAEITQRLQERLANVSTTETLDDGSTFYGINFASLINATQLTLSYRGQPGYADLVESFTNVLADVKRNIVAAIDRNDPSVALSNSLLETAMAWIDTQLEKNDTEIIQFGGPDLETIEAQTLANEFTAQFSRELDALLNVANINNVLDLRSTRLGRWVIDMSEKHNATENESAKDRMQGEAKRLIDVAIDRVKELKTKFITDQDLNYLDGLIVDLEKNRNQFPYQLRQAA